MNETVFREQPSDFVDPRFANHVCKLKKTLYGLKEAPRAWFHLLSSFLIAKGFRCSRSYTSPFVFKREVCIIYLLVYVDDLILTGNNKKFISSFIAKLHHEFAIKDLSDLNYFLSLEVSYTDDGRMTF